MKKVWTFLLLAVSVFVFACAGSIEPRCANDSQFQKIELCSHTQTCLVKHKVHAKLLFVVATDDETKRIVREFNLKKCINDNFYVGGDVACVQVGIGSKSVSKYLSHLKVCEAVQVVNIGYCGSNFLKMGTVYEVNKSARITGEGKEFALSEGKLVCYTSDEFVLQSDIKDACVFDMELYAIVERFPNLVSYKIVSDNLSHVEYEDFTKIDADEVWQTAFAMLKARFNIKYN